MMADLSKSPRWQVSTKQRVRARSLRADSTDAERLIWAALRAHRMKDTSFRRQTPIGPYIVDFVCHAASLIVELDGGQHFEAQHVARDVRRDAFLVSKGFRVLRFNNHDVMTNRQGVLETIAAAIELTPSLTLPRKRGRGHTVRIEREGAS
jgi:very-short-patch-repair endonuclease